jgi:hypothetical protein
MLRCTNFASSIALAGALLVLPAIASAQSSGEAPKPPEQAQEVDQKPEGENKAAEQAKAEQEAAARAAAEYDEAEAKLPRAAGAPECVWTGRRIVSLLWRDDIDTARQYIDLYDRFKCSQDHLKMVFRCLIKQGPLDAKAPDHLATRVQNCWITPDGEATAATEKTNSTNVKPTIVPN